MLTMISFFGEQEGDFSLEINSIKAIFQSDDLEKGIASEKGEVGESNVRSQESQLLSLKLIRARYKNLGTGKSRTWLVWPSFSPRPGLSALVSAGGEASIRGS